MNINRADELLEKYAVCQECGSDRIGGGAGSIYVDDMSFSRICKCGWSVKVDDAFRELMELAETEGKMAAENKA